MTATEQATTHRPPQDPTRTAGNEHPKPKGSKKNGDDDLDDSATQEALSHEGDPEAGHYTPDELADQVAPRYINARDRRAYNILQAEKNEAANDEVNAREFDVFNENRKNVGLIADPDRMREETLKSALADIDMHTRDGKAKRIEARREIAEAREKVCDPTPVPGRTEGGAETDQKDRKDRDREKEKVKQ